jgi:hydrogenase nickel incorporation protein HypA/HybF
MHELSLTQSLVSIAEEHARNAGARVIRNIILEVGELCGADPEALVFAFDVCSRGTLAEGAALSIRRVAGRGICKACAATVACRIPTVLCPYCGALAVVIDTGSELRILALEVD